MTMIQINLLPREMRRTSGGVGLSKSSLVGVAALAGVMAVLAGLTFMQSARHNAVQGEIARAQIKVDELRDDIALVDRLEEVKTKILRRMNAIETLDNHRGYWVRNVEDILAVIPSYLWLSGFHREDPRKAVKGQAIDSTLLSENRYLLDGFCFTISSLANMILNMQDSPRFENVQLRRAQIKDLKKRHVYEFQVACELIPLDEATGGIEDVPATSVTVGSRPTQRGAAMAATPDWYDAPAEEARP
ncbi:MAG TPA: PilN domain-containing protein [candidate division Zixibacteria bacterium]|jgi:Tfp pilus assembly protein PilN